MTSRAGHPPRAIELIQEPRYDGSYRAAPLDPHYGATAPLEPEPCRCSAPFEMADDDDPRCFMCGKSLGH
jgi:hypothetical protein